VGDYYGFASEGAGGGIDILRERYRMSDFTRLAIDPMGDYLAVADESGNILVGDISSFKSPEREGFFEYATRYRLFGYSGKDIRTVDLEFDPTHSWLGWLTDERLVVWSLKNYVFPLEFKTNLQDGNVICFDRTGKILAIGTKNGLKIFDVKTEKEIANYSVGEVSTLYFSRDNRLLIWGDVNGNTHLWGIK